MIKGKIVKVIDDFTIVTNIGRNLDIKIGQEFKIIGIGDEIFDPDTNEALGNLEIFKGVVKVTYLQEKISTMTSARSYKEPDIKEIRKFTPIETSSVSNRYGALGGIGLYVERKQEEIIKTTEGQQKLKPLDDVFVGDVVILIG
jgi:hypothetical protein